MLEKVIKVRIIHYRKFTGIFLLLHSSVCPLNMNSLAEFNFDSLAEMYIDRGSGIDVSSFGDLMVNIPHENESVIATCPSGQHIA